MLGSVLTTPDTLAYLCGRTQRDRMVLKACLKCGNEVFCPPYPGEHFTRSQAKATGWSGLIQRVITKMSQTEARNQVFTDPLKLKRDRVMPSLKWSWRREDWLLNLIPSYLDSRPPISNNQKIHKLCHPGWWGLLMTRVRSHPKFWMCLLHHQKIKIKIKWPPIWF